MSLSSLGTIREQSVAGHIAYGADDIDLETSVTRNIRIKVGRNVSFLFNISLEVHVQ